VLRGLATRPGKSLLLSSHLLGDIERVCATAVILHAGQVLGTGRIADLRTATAPCYRIRWDGAGESFLADLQQRGANVADRPRADEARVLVPEGWSNRQFFAAAREQDVLLTGLEPEEENLEAVYHRLIGKHDG
jgi:ABC-2 type transport system ATP-binding protein